jgi:thioredoxin-dependent peroxiredoxin
MSQQAVEQAGEPRLKPGDPAPDFTLPDADRNPLSLASMRGTSVIVYFYPAAMTPGCTTQARDFRDNAAELAAAGVRVLGVSPDSPERLAEFRDRDRLTFPLLSDPDHAVHLAYGAYGQKLRFGQPVTGVIRSTFVITPEGLIGRAEYNVNPDGHVARLRAELGL